MCFLWLVRAGWLSSVGPTPQICPCLDGYIQLSSPKYGPRCVYFCVSLLSFAFDPFVSCRNSFHGRQDATGLFRYGHFLFALHKSYLDIINDSCVVINEMLEFQRWFLWVLLLSVSFKFRIWICIGEIHMKLRVSIRIIDVCFRTWTCISEIHETLQEKRQRKN